MREASISGYPEFNFIFKNGFATEFKASCKLSEVRFKPDEVPVKRIVMYHRTDGYVGGFELYAKDGTQLYKTAYDYEWNR